MCLNKLLFNMEYDKKQKEYYGVGFKKIYPGAAPTIGEWLIADGRQSLREAMDNGLKKLEVPDSERQSKLDYPFTVHGLEKTDLKYDEYDMFENEYHAGFHIFLNKEDAINYEYISGPVYQVEYKNVLAFGTNATDSDEGPCIVAQYMRFVGVATPLMEE